MGIKNNMQEFIELVLSLTFMVCIATAITLWLDKEEHMSRD